MTTCTKETVIELANGLGFALVGVAPARASGRSEYVRGWLASGQHGEMDYLAKNVEVRLDPRELLAGARSVICVADRYSAVPTTDGESSQANETDHPPIGRVARYAWGDDYHLVIKKRLHALADALRDRWPEHEYRTAVDTAPVLEREHATRAGLGWTGKHTLLIHPRLGSWLLLGEIVTTLEIEAEGARQEENERAIQNGSRTGFITPLPFREGVGGGSSVRDLRDFHPSPNLSPGWERGPETAIDMPDLDAGHCGTCTRCINACPTGCIDAYRLDASRCIGYLTIEHRGVIDAGLHEAMGDWVAGCDVCQEVCPFNDVLRIDRVGGGADQSACGSIHPRYATRSPGPQMRLIDVLGWDAQARQEVMRGSALKRIKLDMMKRNALIAAGNHLLRHDDKALRARVEALAADSNEPELVRETAKQVVGRLAANTHSD